MAEMIDHNWGSTKGRPKQYPWEDWTNGNTWKVKYGVDFGCRVESFRAYLYVQAHHRRLSVRSSRLNDKEVIFQFLKTDNNGSK